MITRNLFQCKLYCSAVTGLQGKKKQTTQDISVTNMVTNKCKINKKSKTGFGNASMTRHHTFSITFFKVANCFVWILKANKGTWQLEGEMPCSLTSSAHAKVHNV